MKRETLQRDWVRIADGLQREWLTCRTTAVCVIDCPDKLRALRHCAATRPAHRCGWLGNESASNV